MITKTEIKELIQEFMGHEGWCTNVNAKPLAVVEIRMKDRSIYVPQDRVREIIVLDADREDEFPVYVKLHGGDTYKALYVLALTEEEFCNGD